jgi:4-hydroxybenzoate polyprenyltransferase
LSFLLSIRFTQNDAEDTQGAKPVQRITESTNQRVNKSNMSAWLRLIRWPNLLIIAGTQFVAWWCVVRPLQPAPVLTFGHFASLCCSTVFIAAGGYIINDYFDIRIDAINKPDKVILERTIPRRLAIIVHSVMNALTLLLASFVAIPAGHPEWMLLQVLCAFLLWRYSTTWKRQLIIGNVVVALMTALTIGALLIYEPALRLPRTETSLTGVLPDPVWILCIFMFFAFALTWMREIVKDMEDYKGDDAEGCITMPIRWGLLRSTRFVQAIGILVIAVLVGTCVVLWRCSNRFGISAIYIASSLIVPLALWLINLPRAATVAHYHRASTRIKWIMVSGVVSLLVLHLINYA